MEHLKKEQLYCSLDIETSGFDPAVNEVLEVGFAFFKVAKTGLQITEEWSQVFKPAKEVSPQILGLTGISQLELEQAPRFEEFREFLQDKLGAAVIVGHNIAFDIKFLEGFGLKFSGTKIDTLDLAQFILPTHHSYNLENLMHTFGVRHKEAHRALPDAKATLVVLQKLLGVYGSFPDELKSQIQGLLADHSFPWVKLLVFDLPKVKMPENLQPSLDSRHLLDFQLRPKTIYDLPASGDLVFMLAKTLASQNRQVLLVVPKIRQVMAVWQAGLAEAVLAPEFLFNPKKFSAALAKKELSEEETKFLLKVLVWKYTNWQQKTILDLNLSFFGGQFRSLINGGKARLPKTSKLVCADQQTFLELAKTREVKSRFVAILGLQDFEDVVSSNIGVRVSWGQVIYALKNIYDPELNLGDQAKKPLVLELLAAADLFFGLANALLRSREEAYVYYKIDETAMSSANYNKIEQAAENFAAKLEKSGRQLEAESLGRYAANLRLFFQPQDNRVKWIELAENRCVFCSNPVDISLIVKTSLRPFKELGFFDSLVLPELREYFIARLGLQDFQTAGISKNQEPASKNKLLQGDLFSRFLIHRRPDRERRYHLSAQNLDSKGLLEILTRQALPAAILFANPLAAKQFYNQYYPILKDYASLLLQSSSGGGNKIFRNFGISGNGLLLATDRFVLKFLSNPGTLNSSERLPVKTLVFMRLPFEPFTHPYQEAVSRTFSEPFLQYSLPRALYHFHQLLQFFNTNKLQNLLVYDPKLDKGYAQVFKKYLQQLPHFIAV